MYNIKFRYLTPERARSYDRTLFPWTVRIVAVWILVDAFAPALPPESGWGEWFIQFGLQAGTNAFRTGQEIVDGNWEGLIDHWKKTYFAGWPAFFMWVFGMKIFKEIPFLYGLPVRLFLRKKVSVKVAPDAVELRGRRYERDAIGPLAVLPHEMAHLYATQNQLRHQAGFAPDRASMYFQNTFDVVMPYHGHPIVVAHIYGTQRLAEGLATDINYACKMTAQGQSRARGGDEFGPNPTLPD